MKLKITFMKLMDLLPNSSARVAALDVDEDVARRLRAVGVFESESIVVLRRAPFGGPLHVRTSSGGEFAIDRRIAVAIDVEPIAEAEAAE